MSPPAGAAPTQPAASAALAPLAIAAPEPDRAAPPSPPPPQANRRDPPGHMEGADPCNAAARKTAWNVPAPPPAAAAPGGIMGDDASWPALAWPKSASSASSDSLKSLSNGSAPFASEDLIVSSPLPHPVANPISTGSNPTSTSPPNATAAASSQQNGSTNQPNPVRHGGSNGGNSGGGIGGNGSSGGYNAGNNSSDDGNNGSGGDGNWNNGSIGSGSGCNSGYGDTSNINGGGGSNLNNSVHSGGTSGSGSGNDSSRRALANNNWNGHGRGGGGSNNNGTGSGDGSNRNSGGGGNLWNNNARNGSGSSNGFGGRGGRNRRDHERGGSFTPRNYPRLSPVPHQQQQPGIYQPGPFHRPPPPPAHFMMPQPFVPYAPPFAYPGDVQAYPFYLTPVEQFQNMHLVRQPMQPLWVHQDQQNLQEGIRLQMEFYFSTNNLCHDTYLRRHMNDQGWVPIDLIAQFNRMRRFTDLVDFNYILDAIRGSEMLEVQGNNVRRRNDWAEWLLH